MSLPRIFFAVAVFSLVPVAAHAQWHGPDVPDSLSFQGLLTDTTGTIVPDGTYELLFRMYKGSNQIWQQTESNVPVQNGVFNVVLTGSSLDTVAFNEAIDLGITVNGGTEISPRTGLTSSAYALGVRGLVAVWSDDGFDRAFNVIGGAPNNYVASGVTGATINGGGGWRDTSPKPDSVTGDWGTVSGGFDNTAASHAAVGGGTGNKALSLSSTVGGGAGNKATGQQSTVGGGGGNVAGDNWATVAGGTLNEATLTAATVAGGSQNEATGERSTVGGGDLNEASGQYAVVSGGDSNVASSSDATVAGGENNEARGSGSVVSGGRFNIAEGGVSMIPGGLFNRALGSSSLAAGYKARANHDGTFVWNDRSITSDNDSLVSTGENQFIVRADGGFGIGTASPSEQLHINSGGPSAIFLGGNGVNGPHGIVFDDTSPGNGVQLMWRSAPKRLVIEPSSPGTGSNPADAFFFDRDDFNFGFGGVVRPITDDAVSLGTGSFRWSEVFATIGVINTSDARLKQDVVSIESGLDLVMGLRPVRFSWRGQPGRGVHLGLLAQEVERVVPEVVTPPGNENEHYGLNYGELVPLLIRAIQDQQRTIEELKSQNEELGQRLAIIEQSVIN